MTKRQGKWLSIIFILLLHISGQLSFLPTQKKLSPLPKHFHQIEIVNQEILDSIDFDYQIHKRATIHSHDSEKAIESSAESELSSTTKSKETPPFLSRNLLPQKFSFHTFAFSLPNYRLLATQEAEKYNKTRHILFQNFRI
ncbi:hypothetical protein [Sphingobacterium sp. LRF_L2]|uniref:hypothetical protein n=1 Tax=Sphingobacterium sp. LRF_L2 TaxID=3369421 RepID=UPI003F63CA37